MRYVAGRIGQAVLVLWAAYTVSFLILYLLPGDAIETIATGGGTVTVDPEQLAALKAQYGLDQPLIVQYFSRLAGLFTGNLGVSFSTGQSVTSTIAEALPSTLTLAGLALLLAIVLAIVIALLIVLLPSAPLRAALLEVPVVLVAIPTFWMGLILLQIFSFQLGWLPSVGANNGAGLVLPVVTLALPTAAIIAQVLAASINAVMREPFVGVARAKGMSESRLVSTHVLRNAALPALTVAGVAVGNLLAGSVVVETVFSRPGIGRLVAQAVSVQDIPVVQGVVLFAAVCFVVTNLVVDLLYPVIDARVTFRKVAQ